MRHLLEDPVSPIVDFYPRTFELDLKEGDKDWQATVLLPFVDEARLRKAMSQVVKDSDLSKPKPATAFLAEAGTTESWDFDASSSLPPSRASRDAAGTPIQFAEAAAAAQAAAKSGSKGKGKGKQDRKGGGKRKNSTSEEKAVKSNEDADKAAVNDSVPVARSDESRDCTVCCIA